MFSKVKHQVKDNFDSMAKSSTHLFHIEVDREKVYEIYLDGFVDEVERIGHTCNCCKSFLRQYAGIVSIKNNKVISIWDIPLESVDELYRPSIKGIQEYIHSLVVTNIFIAEGAHLGTDKSPDPKNNVVWEHFYAKTPDKFVHRGSSSIDTKLGEARDNKNVLQRSLNELTLDACDTILGLIAQNSLYRGNEFKPMVKQFRDVKNIYNALPANEKDNFCWDQSVKLSASICRIKNSSIGTLLSDLSEGVEIDRAVTSFERVVAPSNYKRPTALVTPGMIKAAQEKIQEMGFTESLNRRYANITDVSVNDLLFVDRSSELTDVFADMQKEVKLNPKTFSKVEEISAEDFINKVVPTAKSIEVFLENVHLPNFVSMVAAQDPDAPSMFKWKNPMSWSYTGGITDSIKERVKAAGGNVNGVLRTSLSWYNYDDLDIHVIEPNNNKIYFSTPRSSSSGVLDVDMNAGAGHTREAVENIVWTDERKMHEGTYTVQVNNYRKRETTNPGFVVELEFGGELYNFERKTSPRDGSTVTVVEFEYTRKKGIVIKGDAKSTTQSKDKWGLSTNQMVKVKNIMLSPNYWNEQTGNKHYLFMLENCVSDEAPRPFFNEFLNGELTENRKVLEVLGSKLKVEHTNDQLSGIGFSETQRNHLIVKVEGTFKRMLKIKF
jgi:hypothetical protein